MVNNLSLNAYRHTKKLTSENYVNRNFGTFREDGSPVHCWDAEIETLEALSHEGRLTICRAVTGNTTHARQHNRECGVFDRHDKPQKVPSIPNIPKDFKTDKLKEGSLLNE
jgi:hypothetical protein